MVSSDHWRSRPRFVVVESMEFEEHSVVARGRRLYEDDELSPAKYVEDEEDEEHSVHVAGVSMKTLNLAQLSM